MFGFRDIDIIRAIFRYGGFRAASDATGLAQSAISRRVRHLEDRMHITIFERDGRGVRLTAAGRRLVEEAEVLITQRDRILSELTQSVMAGVVRLGVAETMTHAILPRMLTSLHSRHPQLRFEISVDTSEQMGQMLIADGLDVAILMRDQAPRAINLTPLPPVTLGWFVAPAHFNLPRSAGIHDLATLPIVSFPKATLPHRQVVNLLSPGADRRWRCTDRPHWPRCCIWLTKGLASTPSHTTSLLPGRIPGWKRSRSAPRPRLPDLDFAVCYMPKRNEEIGREITRAAVEAAGN